MPNTFRDLRAMRKNIKHNRHHDSSHQVFLDLGRGEQGAGDSCAAVKGVAAQNGGIVPPRNLYDL